MVILFMTILPVTRVAAQTDPKLTTGQGNRVTKIIWENKQVTAHGDTTVDLTIEYLNPDSSTGLLHVRNVGYTRSDSTQKTHAGHIVLPDGTVQEVDAGYTRAFAVHALQHPEDRLFIIDGVETPHEKLRLLDPNKIATINSYSGDEAIAKYGEKARDGAIVITTKTRQQ